jgi:peptide chain release factor 3
MGQEFQGVYDRENKAFYKFERAEKQGRRANSSGPLSGPEALAETVGEGPAERLADEDMLLDEAGNPFEMEAFLAGETTPVFFGSAMNDFGVEPFLKRFMSLCPTPTSRKTDQGDVSPTDEEFSGFVFKIQANMDPKHRDRIAFLRVCSGRFTRGMQLLHPRTGRKITVDRSLQFLAQSRETVEVAYPGDILGLWDPGILRIGDALVEKKPRIFDGIPIFSPEHFVRPVLADPMKRKQMNKGLEQLSEEGAVQVFRDRDHSMVDPVLGAVGWLQIEVVQHRLKAEYGVDARFDRLPFKCARWVEGDDYAPEKLGYRDVRLVFDVADRPLLLFKDKWTLDRLQEKADHLTFISAVQPARRESGR